MAQVIEFVSLKSHKIHSLLARQKNKRNLPSKVCPVCEKPFNWRKKWERDWENVKYCSERCRRSAKKEN